MMTGTKPRLFVLSALAATVVALPASDARADELTSCDLTVSPYKCAKLLVDSPFTKTLGEDAGFSNNIDTGWVPKCPDPKADPHCDKLIQAKASANLKDTKVSVTLSSDWVIKWGAAEAGLPKGSVRIGPRKKSPGGGDMKVTYKLYPIFSVYASVAGFKGEFDFDPFDILKLVKADKIGVDTTFDYSASCSKKFELWSYAAPSEPCQVKDDSADGGTLFSFNPASLLGKKGSMATEDYVKLAVTLKAGTNAGFTWQTKAIKLAGADKPLDGITDSLVLAYDGSASIEVTAQALGTIAYKGETYLEPTVKVEEIFGQKVNLNIPIGAAKVSVPFDEKLPDTTIQTKLVFPVPNVKATLTPVKFGSVKVGEKKVVSVTINNLGNGIGRVSASSGSPAFKIKTKDLTLPDQGSVTLDIEFTPSDAGAATTEITLVTNNIDGDDQKITVSGTGTIDAPVEEVGGRGGAGGKKPAPTPPEETAGTGGSGGKKTSPPRDEASTEDGGCGCRVPASSGSETPAGVLALAGLAALAFRRRKP